MSINYPDPSPLYLQVSLRFSPASVLCVCTHRFPPVCYLLSLVVFLFVTAHSSFAALLLIGIWAAVSYSLSPLQLSYRPFLGDWLSLFPAMFFLGIAGPWLLLDPLPEWAVQNATINALVCMGWVMVHHIPDIEADQQAAPVKRTSVVWFVDQFGLTFARAPAFLYFLLTGL